MTKPERVEAVADAIEHRRVQLGLTIGEMIARSNVTGQALVPLRKGERKSYNDVTKFGIAQALEWPNDAIDRLFAGESPDASWKRSPEPVPATPAPRVASATADLEELSRSDPEQYELLVSQLRLAAERARQRR